MRQTTKATPRPSGAEIAKKLKAARKQAADAAQKQKLLSRKGIVPAPKPLSELTMPEARRYALDLAKERKKIIDGLMGR